MDVRCNECRTEYNLDETLVSSKGTSVRCTKCNSVFKVYPEKRATGAGDQWILRKEGGEETPFSRMYILQRWITEGKATPNDFISRGGGNWKRLSDIPELKSFFSNAKAKGGGAGALQSASAGQRQQPIAESGKKGPARAEPQSPSAGKSVPMAKAVKISKSIPAQSPTAVTTAPETLPPPPNPQASQPKIAASAPKPSAKAKGSLFDSAKASSRQTPSLRDWQAGNFEKGASGQVNTAENAAGAGRGRPQRADLPVSDWEPDLKETPTPGKSRGKSRGGRLTGDSLLEPPDVEQSVAFSLQSLAASLAPKSPIAQAEVSGKVPSTGGAGQPTPSQQVSDTAETAVMTEPRRPSPQAAAAVPQAATAVPQAAKENPADDSGLDFSQIPASDEDKDWNEGVAVGDVADPAWAEKSGALSHYVEDEDALPPPRRKWGPLVAAIVVLALILGGVYVFAFKRSAVDSLFSSLISSKEIGRYKKFYDRGRENFLLDSESYFRQADREYQKVLALEEDHPTTLAALGEMYAVWAQYLRDAKGEAVRDAEGEDGNEAMNREIERLNNQYEQKLAEALRWTEQAKAAQEVPAEVHRVSADIRRLQGDMEGATKDLHKARAMGADPETDYVATMLDLAQGKPVTEVEASLRRIIENKPLIRAMYRRARLLAGSGKLEEAKEVLGKIFQLNSDHTRALDLAARIDAGKPIPLTDMVEDADDTDQAAESPKASLGSGASPKSDAPVHSPPKDENGSAAAPRATQVKSPSGGEGDSSKSQQGRGSGRTDNMLEQAIRMQRSGKTDAAMKLFEAILAKEPGNLDALCGLGDAYLDKGAFGRAIANYRRALRANSSFGPALLGLAAAFKSLTQNEQAVKYYESYLNAHPNGRQAGMARRSLEQLRGREKAKEPQTEEREPTGSSAGGTEQDKDREPVRNAPAAESAKEGEGAAGEGAEESEE